MKYRLFTLTLTLQLLLLAPLAADTFRVAVFDNAAPVSDLDEQGRPIGFFPEILERMLSDLGHRGVFVGYPSFSDAYRAVAEGEADILPALQYSEERTLLFDYNRVPFMITWSQVFTTPGGEQFDSLFDLTGASIGVMRGDRNGESFLRLAESFDLRFSVRYYPTFADVGDALVRGEVEAGIFFNTYVHSGSRLHPTDIVFNPTEAYIGLTAGRHAELIPQIDARLDELKEDDSSYYHEILKRYLLVNEGREIPRWLYLVISGITLVLLATLLFVLVLQRTIRGIRADLIEQESRYKAIFEQTGSLMLLAERGNGRIRDANEAAVDFYGYPKEKLTGLTVSDLEEEGLAEIPAEPETTTAAQAVRVHRRHRLADGRLRYMQIDVGPVSVQGEQLSIMILHDETEKVEAGGRLQREKLRAEEALAVKNEFLANISHELRTPLNGIIGMLSLLDNISLDAEERYFLTMAQESAELLFEIIRDILDFNLLETKRLKIESETFDLHRALEMGVALFREGAEEKGLDIELVCDFEPRQYRGDRGRLLQILGNLVSNAVKYSEGGTIRVEALRREGLLLRVSDEGIGIAAEKIDSIFTAFHQLEDPYTKKVRGTGLGLSIVRELTELMGGAISVASTPGEGSTFSVTLPDAFTDETASEENDARNGALPQEEFAGRGILIVEDEAINRLYLSQLLKEHGFRVHEANDGEAAVAGCVETGPDLILMDIGLPRQNGIEATRQILSLPRYSATPIIALTAHAHVRDRERFLEAGMVDVVTKPFNEQELIAAIHRGLGAKEAAGRRDG